MVQEIKLKITSVSGINFDRSFDAENRMITSIASGSVSHNAAYSYDGTAGAYAAIINGGNPGIFTVLGASCSENTLQWAGKCSAERICLSS